MAGPEKNSTADDRFDLDRFVQAQQGDYQPALSEIRSGRKRSHWMWYIFPQYAGFGFSPTAQRYAIQSLAEADAYMRHPILGPRLIECAQAALDVEGRSAQDIFGTPDDLKLRSCMTLFAQTTSANPVFQRVLARYYGGVSDPKTLELLGRS